MCQATTLRGTRCKCKAKNGSDYCFRHDNHFECSICYTSKKEKTTTKCGHVFCKECIDKWTKDNHTCPICRSQIREPDTPIPPPTFNIQIPDLPRPPPTRRINITYEMAFADALIERLIADGRLTRYTFG